MNNFILELKNEHIDPESLLQIAISHRDYLLDDIEILKESISDHDKKEVNELITVSKIIRTIQHEKKEKL